MSIIESFSELPALIARELETRRQVVVVLLDAFGWAFVQRHERHPLLARFARDGTLAPLRSQFPSTTTAHVTTMHTGLPVEDHGLYEWRVWEPALEGVTIPLLVGGDDSAGFATRSLLPEGPSFYQRLAIRAGVASTVFSPARFSPSGYDAIAVRGARLVPYDDLSSITLPVGDEKSYVYVYWDMIDAVGHRHGPSSPEFDDACLRALDGLYGVFFGPESASFSDTLLLLTADHGQIDVSPDSLDLLDIPDALPAGSARDLFLHVSEDRVDSTLSAINTTLGDHGTAVRSSTLFPTPGPRLAARLAPICVLPAPGRMVWLRGHEDDPQLSFLGHHGGQTPEESTSFLGTLELG
ncbi:MAG TPA: alkaline phosphatase family protein [Baekduia sp.]